MFENFCLQTIKVFKLFDHVTLTNEIQSNNLIYMNEYSLINSLSYLK